MKSCRSYLNLAVLFWGLSTNFAGAKLASAHKRSESRKETFVGEITRNPEIEYDSMDQLYRYILYDEARKTNYYLDDNGKAEKYDEEKVEIEGILKANGTVIRVNSIKLSK